MTTIQKYFNTEKENYTPSVSDFQDVINAIKMIDEVKPVVVRRRIESPYFKYSFSLLSMAAAFVIFIYNRETEVTLEPKTNQVAVTQVSKKQMQIDNTLLAIDNIKSFDAE